MWWEALTIKDQLNTSQGETLRSHWSNSGLPCSNFGEYAPGRTFLRKAGFHWVFNGSSKIMESENGGESHPSVSDWFLMSSFLSCTVGDNLWCRLHRCISSTELSKSIISSRSWEIPSLFRSAVVVLRWNFSEGILLLLSIWFDIDRPNCCCQRKQLVHDICFSACLSSFSGKWGKSSEFAWDLSVAWF